jgi:geranylgeranyl pyrophosphate synthase
VDPPSPILQTLDGPALRDGAAADEAPVGLADALELVLGGLGKGLRPTVLFAAAGCGPRSSAAMVWRAAVAVEILHTATMAHDDILDRGELRRGRPTVVARHGSHEAATLGTWLLARGLDLLVDCGDEVIAHGSESIARIFGGQLQEVLALYDVGRTPASYFESVTGKTAALFELSAWLGAMLAGAPAGRVAALERYGLELGVAFQIADDIADLLDSEQVGGKRPGRDLHMGVYTLPVIYALEDDPSLRDSLARLSAVEELPLILAAIRGTDGIARALEVCRARVAAAKRAVAELGDSGRLAGIADRAVSRCETVSG